MLLARHGVLAVRLASTRTLAPLSSTSVRAFSSALRNMAKLTDSIKDDHEELEEFYNKTLQAKTADEKDRWRNQLIWELARHAVGEELVVYPAMEKYLSNGKELADHDREEHAKIKETVYKLQDISPDNASFEPTLRALWSTLGPHNKEEETDDLPPLEEKMGADESAKVAKSFERCKMFAPTQGHPGMPQQPPFETAAALMLAPIDKLRDAFKNFPDPSET